MSHDSILKFTEVCMYVPSNLRTLPFGYSFAHPVTFHKNRNIPTLAEDVHFFIICD
jgi:hypothetical protein